MTTPAIELITHPLCPYVQRSVIVLEEKGISYRRTDIDLADKPDWFLPLSPLGKVPVLVMAGQKPIFESAVICEYLDEITPGSLHPSNAANKARHRSWVEFGSSLLNRIGTLYSARDQRAFDLARTQLREALERVEVEIVATPFFDGPAFHLVDAVYAPVFRYFDVFDTFTELGLFDGLDNLNHWRSALRSRPSVTKAVASDYGQRLKTFVRHRQGHLAALLDESVREIC